MSKGAHRSASSSRPSSAVMRWTVRSRVSSSARVPPARSVAEAGGGAAGGRARGRRAGRRRLTVGMELRADRLRPARRASAGSGLANPVLLEGAERPLESVGAGHVAHPLRAGPQLSRGLGPAQQELGQHGEGAVAQLQGLLRVVAVLLDPAPARHADAHETLHAQAMEGDAHLRLGEVEHRIPVALLVAAVRRAVEGERVLVGHRERLLDQHAEHAGLVAVERDLHGGRVRCSGRSHESGFPFAAGARQVGCR